MVAIRIIAGVFIGLIVVLAAFQTSLIFPGAATQGRADAIVHPSDGVQVVTLKARTGDSVVALFGPATTPQGLPHPDAKGRPTLVYFYGNGMCMADCTADVQRFRRRGFNVMVPDYIGYGMSGGKPGEDGVYATADACFDHLRARADVDPRRIVPMGWSLGAAAAIHLASTRAEVPAVVCVSAFTSIADMGKKLFPLLPTGLIVRHRFENETKLRAVRVPVFLAHGTRDGIIPFAMSKQLAAAAGGKVAKHDVQGADHNDVFDVGGAELLDAITAFVNDHAATSGAAGGGDR